MLYLPPTTNEQDSHWQAFLDRMRAMEASERDGDDPWLFHGTSAIRAAWIRREGFKPSSLLIQDEDNPSRPGDQLRAKGVNWGTVNVAAWAANRAADNDDPPVLLAARLSSLVRAGELVADHYALGTGCSGDRGPYDDIPEREGDSPADPDWRESLAWPGAIGVVGCSRVKGMVFHEPLRDVPVHPDWEEARKSRRAHNGSYLAYLRSMPPRGMPEPTPRTHPPNITSEEGIEQGMMRSYGTTKIEGMFRTDVEPQPSMGF